MIGKETGQFLNLSIVPFAAHNLFPTHPSGIASFDAQSAALLSIKIPPQGLSCYLLIII